MIKYGMLDGQKAKDKQVARAPHVFILEEFDYVWCVK